MLNNFESAKKDQTAMFDDERCSLAAILSTIARSSGDNLRGKRGPVAALRGMRDLVS
ncbi:hypothetical protein NX020_21785 [Escherichia coli]|nr:hypothetical protein [Escherichia coli]